MAMAQQTLKEGEFLVAKDVAASGIKHFYIFDSIEEFLREQENHHKHYYERMLEAHLSEFLTHNGYEEYPCVYLPYRRKVFLSYCGG